MLTFLKVYGPAFINLLLAWLIRCVLQFFPVVTPRTRFLAILSPLSKNVIYTLYSLSSESSHLCEFPMHKTFDFLLLVYLCSFGYQHRWKNLQSGRKIINYFLYPMHPMKKKFEMLIYMLFER